MAFCGNKRDMMMCGTIGVDSVVPNLSLFGIVELYKCFSGAHTLVVDSVPKNVLFGIDASSFDFCADVFVAETDR